MVAAGVCCAVGKNIYCIIPIDFAGELVALAFWPTQEHALAAFPLSTPPCYCTISRIYAAACAATAVAVCRSIIKRPLGVFSAHSTEIWVITTARNISPNRGTHTCWPPIGCVYYDYGYDYVIGQARSLLLPFGYLPAGRICSS